MATEKKTYYLDCEKCKKTLLIKDGDYCNEITCLVCGAPICTKCGGSYTGKGMGLRHRPDGINTCKFKGYQVFKKQVSKYIFCSFCSFFHHILIVCNRNTEKAGKIIIIITIINPHQQLLYLIIIYYI